MIAGNMKKTHWLALYAVLFFYFSCHPTGKKENNENTIENEVDNKKSGSIAICIYDKIPLLTKPSRKEGKWITSLALGEKVTYLGEQQTDETSKVSFVKIRTSDNQEGYADARVIIPNAEVACITDHTPIYSRPDLTTVTQNSFEPFDIIAIVSRQGEWTEIVGKRRKGSWIDKGWIKSKSISKDEKDIATAVYCVRALSQNTTEKTLAELKKIQNNNDLKGSIFEREIAEMIEKLSGGDSENYRKSISTQEGDLGRYLE
ncbi:MAG: SH3 domain-containing protein [Bacteroidia bacterium]|nr:SH3 domain-containing protein [Bacteroidia bacterium]